LDNNAGNNTLDNNADNNTLDNNAGNNTLDNNAGNDIVYYKNNNNIHFNTKPKYPEYCICGNKNEANWNYCPICSRGINGNITKDTLLNKPGIYIFLFFFGIVLGFIFSPMAGAIISIVSIVIALIKFPRSPVINILFFVTLAIVVIAFIIFLIIKAIQDLLNTGLYC
ncbi:MAG: hypothetical protein K6G88_06705, partial [Lachnospiraceae bacterium]|nr:hypothetical protein [Lachnospiraceae bacterium]